MCGAAAAQQLVEQVDELRETVGPLPWGVGGRIDDAVVEAAGPGSQAADEPAARDVLEGHHLLGQRHRVTVGGCGHHGAHGQGRGGLGRRRQGGHGAEPGLVTQPPPHQLVIGPGVVESELLGADPLFAGPRPPAFGQDDDSVPHGPPLLSCRVIG